MSGRSSKLWIVKKRTAGLIAWCSRIAATKSGSGGPSSRPYDTTSAERRQHREIAAEPLAAYGIEDQVGATPLGRLAHPGDDILAAIVDRRRSAPSPSTACRFASEPATPMTRMPAIRASCTAALPTPPAAVCTSTVFGIDPARRGVQHVIGDLVVRQACRRFEIDSPSGSLWAARRRHRDILGIAAGPHRQVAGADEHRRRRPRGSAPPAPHSTIVPLISMPGIAGKGGIQA